MAYQSTVFNLMISCPSDAEDEYEVLRNCIHDWNEQHSEHNEINLLPVYHRTHVPSIVAEVKDPRGQGVINERIVRNSDWLIAIFKNEFGTPTGKADSGTMEEIELFKKLYPGRPASAYFYKNSKDEKVQQYKKTFPGYRKVYKSKTDLRMEFMKDIFIMVYRESHFCENIVNYKQKVDAQYELLLMAASRDVHFLIVVSKLTGQQLIIETNGMEYANFGSAFKILYQRGEIDKKGGDIRGELFVLNDLGKQHAEALKFV